MIKSVNSYQRLLDYFHVVVAWCSDNLVKMVSLNKLAEILTNSISRGEESFDKSKLPVCASTPLVVILTNSRIYFVGILSKVYPNLYASTNSIQNRFILPGIPPL